ncbi:MAG: hypothetical protein HFJ54_02445 [Clostridia bacterium]|nr:hypothetical protein [Clostridia bacterium]
MKLQNLVIIFIVIALPVIIILSVFIEYQVDTVNLKADYSDKLLSATHDTLVTFQMNTTKNKYSSVSDSLIRDIEASINTFATTLSTRLGMSGSNKDYAMSYIPALLFTLYDGYYIYTPTAKEDGTFEHSLKPYVYYTKQYESASGNKKVVINFSLDNYVAVYYDNNDDNLYRSRAGYLEILSNSEADTRGVYYDEASERVYYKGIEIERDEQLFRKTYTYNLDDNGAAIDFNNNNDVVETSTSAYDYYKEAWYFTHWYNEIMEEALGGINFNNSPLNIGVENSPLPGEPSRFNDEKNKVIEDTITRNLIQAMEAFSGHADEEFRMPELTGEDWYTILNNVCIISFMQGMPCGTTTYNDYVIIPSTENNEYVNEKDIYYIGYNVNPTTGVVTSTGTAHRIGCEKLQGDLIVRI